MNSQPPQDVPGDSKEKKPRKRERTPPDVFITCMVLLLIGFMASMPCLCREGVIKSESISILYWLIVFRLGWDYFRTRLYYSIIAIYSLIFIAFCWLVESL